MATTLLQNVTARARAMIRLPSWNIKALSGSRNLESSTAAGHSAHNQQKQGFTGYTKEEERRILLTFSMISAPICFGIGSYYMQLLIDEGIKEDYRKTKVGMEPLNCNQISSSNGNLDSLDFRRIRCKGVYDHKKSIYIPTKVIDPWTIHDYISRIKWRWYYSEGRHLRKSIDGYNLITPLYPIPGDPKSVPSPILVNRGWVPPSWKDEALSDASPSQHDEQVPDSSSISMQDKNTNMFNWFLRPKKSQVTEGTSIVAVEVTGVARGSGNAVVEVLANDPSSSQWLTVNIPEHTQACGLPAETIYLEEVKVKEIESSLSYPIPKDLVTVVSNPISANHYLLASLKMYFFSLLSVIIMMYLGLTSVARQMMRKLLEYRYK